MKTLDSRSGENDNISWARELHASTTYIPVTDQRTFMTPFDGQFSGGRLQISKKKTHEKMKAKNQIHVQMRLFNRTRECIQLKQTVF